MARHSTKRIRVASLILGFVGLSLALAAVQVRAQTSIYPGQGSHVQRETPAAALARHIRVLATSPRDFMALIGAGKAALALGDTQSAVGFFGRAEEIFPRSPLPNAGMGAALAADGDARGALGYFARAQQLGASATIVGADRGLAYDLLGRHAEAQADYRAALMGSDADEARRRLALSQAIVGDKAGALATLAPLNARGDAGAARGRALVLALSGDLDGARRSLDVAMPGSAAQMAPFLARLPSLRSDEKVAAVNLGIFPTSSSQSHAAVSPPSTPAAQPPVRRTAPAGKRSGSTIAGARAKSGGRLAAIDQLLKSPAVPSSTAPAARPTQIANIPLQMRRPPATPAGAGEVRPRVWVQLASGPNSAALPEQFKRIKTRHKDLLEGISGYVAEAPDRARLLIGPFRNRTEANIFVEDLASLDVNAFSWTSRTGDLIRKLP